MGKRFRFRLEVVRQVRRRAEDAAQRAVARRVQEIQSIDNRQVEIDGILEILLRDARAAAAASHPDVPWMARQRHYLGRLRRQRLECAGRRGGLVEILRRERAVLVEAARQAKVMDKLREKALAAHALAEQRAEDAAADELAVQHFVHGRLAGE